MRDLSAINRQYPDILGSDSVKITPGEILKPGSAPFNRIISNLREKGDGFLKRTLFHSEYGRMSEQMSRYDGSMKGASDLTWSYASFVTAVDERRRVAFDAHKIN